MTKGERFEKALGRKIHGEEDVMDLLDELISITLYLRENGGKTNERM